MMPTIYLKAGGYNNRVFLPDFVMLRVRERNLRDPYDPRAGNFCEPSWNNFIDILKEFQDELSEEIDGLLRTNDLGIHDVTIDFERPVGWVTTTLLCNIDQEALEKTDFKNGRGHALFVKKGRDDIEAPLSNEITFLFDLSRDEDGRPIIKFISCYPGISPGELVGDVSKREQIAFFDWEHPGEAPAREAQVA